MNEPQERPARSSFVYLVESLGWGSYELLAVYDNEASACAHADDANVVKEHGTGVTIREFGVRSRKQLKPLHERKVR